MSVVFKPVAMDGTRQKYQIVITVNSFSPELDLQDITSDIISVLRNVRMDGREENYFYLLDFLKEMIPDSKTYESMKKQVEKVSV